MKPFNKKIKKFDTAEIMTGGIIPKGFDTIIPIEQIIFAPNKKYILIDQKIKKFNHVRFAGSDYKKGEVVIKKNTIVQPNHILAFKSLGIKQIKVKKRSRMYDLEFLERVILSIFYVKYIINIYVYGYGYISWNIVCGEVICLLHLYLIFFVLPKTDK